MCRTSKFLFSLYKFHKICYNKKDMKIIHTGDIHIGSAFSLLSAEKARLRQAEITDGFRRLCAYARENKIEVVLIAGDLFDDNGVLPQVKNETLAAIAAAAPTIFFYVSGNHDDEFYAQENLPNNLYVFSQQHGWKGYDLPENVSITGMDTRNFSAEKFASLKIDETRFNVVLLHGDVSATGKESIPLSLLAQKPIDYLALGHIHKPDLQSVRFSPRGQYRYCGCLESRGFDEIGARGFFLLEVVNGKICDEKFYSLATREVRELRIDITGCKNYVEIENATFSAVANVPQTHLVKVVLYGAYTLGLQKELALLESKLCARFFGARIEDNSRLAFRAEDFANDASIYGKFVKEVGRYAFNDKQREEILEIGLKALRGESIEL